MTGGFLYTLPSYPPRLRAEQASRDHSSPLISFGSASSSNSSDRGTRGCRGGGGRRPDAVVMETLERSASQAQSAQRAQQAQRVDPLEALPLRMALSDDALLDAYAAGPSSQEATDVHVSLVCCSALPVGSIQHAVSMMALTSQHKAQMGDAASIRHDDAQQGLSHPNFSLAQALRTESLIEFGSLREPSFSELMPPVGSIQHAVSNMGLNNPSLQPSIISAPSWGATSTRAVQLPARLAASCQDRSMHSSEAEPVILQQRSSGGSASGQLPAHSLGMAGTECPAGLHSLGEPSFSAVMLAAFKAFQSEEADMPDVPDNLMGVPDIEAAPVPAFLTSGGWPQNSQREVDGQVSSGLHLHMMLPAGEIAMQQAVDSDGSRKAGDASARACSQSADVSSAEGRPVRRVGSAPEATSRSRRLRQRGNRRILEANSDSEGAKTGALGRVERNRVIQREYLVRKRLQEYKRSLGFETSAQKSVPKQARQEAVHAQAAQLAADVEQLRAEVAALWKRSDSLERILARPSNEAGPSRAAGTDISMTDAPDISRYSPMAWRNLLETMALSPAQAEALTSLGARSDHQMASLRARREQAALALLEPPPAPLSGYAVSRMHLEAEHLLGCLQDTVELEKSWETTFDAIARQVLLGSQQGMLQAL